MYNGFKEEIKKFVDSFNEKKYNLIKIVSHNDCDGICAAAILTETFKRKSIKYSLSIFKKLSLEVLKPIQEENWDLLIFSDLGSSHLKEIKEISNGRDFVIFDHHIIPDSSNTTNLINPHAFGINDYNEISGAGVVYLFSKTLDKKNKDLAYLALMGAIGDIQENKGFSGLNKEILEDAVDSGKIETKVGFRMFGSQTKPLHKILEYSLDPYIPGITGNESAAIQFLEDIGIKYREGDKWLRLIDLNNDDLKKLVTNIILRRIGSEEKPEDIFGTIYLLRDEADGNSTKDLKDFSTLLNSCGRMGKPSLGVGACLNKDKTKALELLKEYRGELISALNWFNSHRNSDKIIEGNNFCIVNAGNNVNDNLIGVLASMISKSNNFSVGTILIFMAYTSEETIKFSGRVVGTGNINLVEFFKGARDIGAEIGGHKFAAGGTIAKDREEELLNFLRGLF